MTWPGPTPVVGEPPRSPDLIVHVRMKNLVRCREIIWLAPSFLMMMAPPDLKQKTVTTAVLCSATIGTERTAGTGVMAS